MKITECLANHLCNPIGFHMDVPIFSWKVEGASGSFQKQARVAVALDASMTDICFDSGVREDIDSLACRAEMELAPCTRYFWTVTVWTDAGETAVSAVNYFETAKRNQPWAGRWISCEEKGRTPVFEKAINVSGELSAARLYICGMGLYEARIDGVKVSDEYLTPYCNNYDKWLQYQTFDVTEMLARGGVLQVELGDGWGRSRFGYFSRPGDISPYEMPLELIAEVHLRYADGRKEIIGTDESWIVRRGRIVFSGLYDGEHRDDTLGEAAAEKCFFVEENTPLCARRSLPVTAHEILRPQALLHTPAGESVFDIGQNMSGSFRFRVREPKGTEIRLRFGEVLQGGSFYNGNYRTARAEYRYVSGGDEVVLEPKFSFWGFRYVKVEGVADLRIEDFEAIALYSDLPERGRLRTGHAKLNRLIANAEWGLRGNFLDVPTDCPQRDERMGWTGDAQVFSATACFMRDCYQFYGKYLHDMYTEQTELSGMVPNVVPSFHYHETSSVWGDAACIIPWNLYLFYGDRRILEEQYAGMKAWVEYIRGVDGDSHRWRREYHIGDWLALDHPGHTADECRGGTDEGYIADIYYALSCGIVAKAAAVLGNDADAAKYGALAQRIRADLREEYFSATGRCCINTQTGLVLALTAGIAPEAEVCREMLARLFEETRGKLQTGFVGTPLLCACLSENGMERLAYDLLLSEEYPGWLYEVNLGATTIWERWNSLNGDGTISSTGMNSFNHYAYGSVTEWLYRCAAGLQPMEEKPGFREVRIRPIPDGRLGFVEMRYDSAAGVYEAGWSVESLRRLTVTVTVPFGCRARLRLPYACGIAERSAEFDYEREESGEYVLLPGHYRVTYETAGPLWKVYSADDTVAELEKQKWVRELLEAYFPDIFGIPDVLKAETLAEAVRFRFPDRSGYLEEADRRLREAGDRSHCRTNQPEHLS